MWSSHFSRGETIAMATITINFQDSQSRSDGVSPYKPALLDLAMSLRSVLKKVYLASSGTDL